MLHATLIGIVFRKTTASYDMLDKILFLKEYIQNMNSLSIFDTIQSLIQNFMKGFAPLTKFTMKLQVETYILGDFFEIG